MKAFALRAWFCFALWVVAAVSVGAAPTAVISVFPQVGTVGGDLTFNGYNSTDPGGMIVSYAWDFDNNGTTDATGPTPHYSYARWGTYTAKLTVTNATGQTATTTRTIYVDQLKVQSGTYLGTYVDENGEEQERTHGIWYFSLPCAGTITFSASGSPYIAATFSSPAGTVSTVTDSGGTGSLSSTVTTTNAQAGVWSVDLYGTAYESQGDVSLQVIFTPAYQGPTAVFSASPSSGVGPLAVTFSGSGSTDPDGTITSYTWTSGGFSNTGVAVTRTLPTGIYPYKLTVADNHGLYSIAYGTVTVNDPPVVALARSVSIVGVGQGATITATATDVDGNATSIVIDSRAPGSGTWVTGTVAAGTALTDSPAGTLALAKTFTLAMAGVWTFRATATDALGVSSAISTITVTAGPDITAPTAPTGVGVSNLGALSCTLSWTAATDDVAVTGYEVRRGSTSLGTTSATSMAITGLSASTAYQFEVRARDAAGNWSAWTSSGTVTTTALQPPVASFKASPAWNPASWGQTFDASASTDANGTITTYAWDIDNNGTVDSTTSSATSTLTFPKYGVYTVKLTVTSSSGLSASTTRQISVGPDFAEWVLSSSGHLYGGFTNTHVVTAPSNGLLIAFVSQPGGFRFDSPFGLHADTTSEGNFIVVGPVAAGDVTVNISGIDAQVEGDYMLQVGFAPAPRPVVAAFTATPEYGVAPLTVNFDASASSAPDTHIGTYTWNFGTAGTGLSVSPTFSRTFSTPGTYTAALTLNDGVTTPAVASKTIVVNGPAAAIVVQPTGQTVNPGSTVRLSVGATGSPAPTYQWKRGTDVVIGATGPTLTLSSVTASQAGSYTVTVTNTLGSATSTPAVVIVNPDALAPVITTSPVNQSITAGDTLTLTAGAAAYPAPTYQWYRNGAAISGATSAIYTLTYTPPSAVGSYTVVATNPLGTATSAAATVTVQGSRFLLGHNTGASVLATANGGDPGRRIGIASWANTPTPTDFQFFGFDTVAPSGVVEQISIGGDNTSVNGVAILGPEEFALSALYCIGEHAVTTITAPDRVAVNQTFNASATTTNPHITYQVLQYSTDFGAHWSSDGGFFPNGGPSSVDGTHTVSHTMTPSALGVIWLRAFGGELGSSAWQTGLSVYAYKRVIVATEAPPIILDQPVSAEAFVGESVTFRAVCSAVPDPTYVWRKDGVPIADATASTFTIGNIQENDAGDYTVVVSNSQGSVTSSIASLVLRPKPMIVGSLAATPYLNTPFSYQVTALFCDAAHAPVSYYALGYPAGLSFNTTTGVLSGTTTVGGVHPVILKATNSYGSSDFAVLYLDVIEPPDYAPRFGQQPESTTVLPGGTTTFAATVFGKPTPSLQWYRIVGGTNTPVSGATSATLTIANASQSTHGGSYQLVATNSQGSAASNLAVLEVNASPTGPQITVEPTGKSVATGSTVTFNVEAEGSVGMRWKWRKNGVALTDGGQISGAEGKTLTLASVTASDMGAYSVVVSNSVGTDTSADAPLIVLSIGDDGTPQLRVHRVP